VISLYSTGLRYSAHRGDLRPLAEILYTVSHHRET